MAGTVDSFQDEEEIKFAFPLGKMEHRPDGSRWWRVYDTVMPSEGFIGERAIVVYGEAYRLDSHAFKYVIPFRTLGRVLLYRRMKHEGKLPLTGSPPPLSPPMTEKEAEDNNKRLKMFEDMED